MTAWLMWKCSVTALPGTCDPDKPFTPQREGQHHSQPLPALKQRPSNTAHSWKDVDIGNVISSVLFIKQWHFSQQHETRHSGLAVTDDMVQGFRGVLCDLRNSKGGSVDGVSVFSQLTAVTAEEFDIGPVDLLLTEVRPWCDSQIYSLVTASLWTRSPGIDCEFTSG
ncbi:unnamed protein product [Leuciscus chuanchicus]